MASARYHWKTALQQKLDPKKLVFIDETGTATNMARARGRCRRGARLIGRVPHGHWKTTTLVAGLRIDTVTAPFVIDRAMNGRIFRTYVERCLVPTLAPGDMVIMDNLAAHKVAGVRQQSRRPVPSCSTCRPTRPISIRSSSSSPSSKHYCVKPPNEPSRRYGRLSDVSSTISLPTSVPIISPMPDMARSKWKLFSG